MPSKVSERTRPPRGARGWSWERLKAARSKLLEDEGEVDVSEAVTQPPVRGVKRDCCHERDDVDGRSEQAGHRYPSQMCHCRRS